MTKPQKRILIILAVLLVGLLIATVVVFATRQQETIINDFVPPAFDPAAKQGAPGELDGSRAYNELVLAEYAVAALCANITVENNAAQVYFTSREENTGWMKIKLLDQNGNLLGQSGLIRPGEYLEAVQLTTVPEEQSLILVKILVYEPDTYLSMGSATAQAMLMVE